MSDKVEPPILIRYDLQSLRINDVGVSGIQSISINQSMDASTIPVWGNPFSTKNIYKKPNVELSITKFISDNVPSLPIDPRVAEVCKYGGVLPSGKIIVNPIDSISIDIWNYNNPSSVHPTGLELRDAIFRSIQYNFNTEGFFTEEINFSSHILVSSGTKNTQKNTEGENFVPHTGIVKRRQDFFISGVPAEIARHVSSGHNLLSVSVSIGIEYGDIPSYGRFFSSLNKYIKYPLDISCTFEILDRGFYKETGNFWIESNYKQQPYIAEIWESNPYLPLYYNSQEVSGNIILGSGFPNTYENIVKSVFEQLTSTGILLGIKDSLTIDLGSNNFLVSKERSGGDAGQSNYSIYRYTYKNTTSEFTLS